MSRIRSFIFRDNASITNEKLPANRICLEWWKKQSNIGDSLAKVIYDYITEYYDLNQNQHVKKRVHLVTIGSLIGMRQFDATIWGSGIHCINTAKNMICHKNYVKYDIRAVRGPVTRNFLMAAGYDCPPIYGDPAVLMPKIYVPRKNKKKYPVSIIYHLSQKDEPRRKDLHYIDVRTTDYRFFVDEIAASERVISSSLHGIILAEAYGVPAVFLNEAMEDELMKFFDWYYSTGRYNIVFASNIDEALVSHPMPLPDLSEMQTRLISTFPKDLWSK